MAVSRLLFLMLFLVASTVCNSDIPRKFLCYEVERGRLKIQVENLIKVVDSCSDLTQLTDLIRLPNSRMHKETWDKTSFQDRMAEVLHSLSNLVMDVESAKMQNSVCGSSLLEKLARIASNYQRILTHSSVTEVVEQVFPREKTRPLQNSKRANEIYSSDLKRILTHFDFLLKGKLEMLMRELEVSCPSVAPETVE